MASLRDGADGESMDKLSVLEDQIKGLDDPVTKGRIARVFLGKSLEDIAADPTLRSVLNGAMGSRQVLEKGKRKAEEAAEQIEDLKQDFNRLREEATNKLMIRAGVTLQRQRSPISAIKQTTAERIWTGLEKVTGDIKVYLQSKLESEAEKEQAAHELRMAEKMEQLIESFEARITKLETSSMVAKREKRRRNAAEAETRRLRKGIQTLLGDEQEEEEPSLSHEEILHRLDYPPTDDGSTSESSQEQAASTEPELPTEPEGPEVAKDAGIPSDRRSGSVMDR